MEQSNLLIPVETDIIKEIEENFKHNKTLKLLEENKE